MSRAVLATLVLAGCGDNAAPYDHSWTWSFVDPASGRQAACPALVNRVEIVAEYPAVTTGDCAGTQPQVAADVAFACGDGFGGFDVTPARPTSCVPGDQLVTLARALTIEGAIYSDDEQRDQPTPMHSDLEAGHGLIKIMWNLVAPDGTTPATCKTGWVVRTSLGGTAPCVTEGTGYAVGQRAGAYDFDVFVGLPPPYPSYGVTHVAGVAVASDTVTTVPVTIRLTQ